MSVITQIEDLTGKIIIAKRRIPAKSGAWNDSAVSHYIEAGQPVGKIWSWLEPQAGRDRLHFMFEKPHGGYFYTEYHPDWYDEVNLKEQIEAEKPTTESPILTLAQNLGMKAMGVFVIIQILKAIILKSNGHQCILSMRLLPSTPYNTSILSRK